MPRTELDKKMSTPAKQVANSPSNQEERGGPVNRCSHSEALFTFSPKKNFHRSIESESFDICMDIKYR
jgi:hypothetical protein